MRVPVLALVLALALPGVARAQAAAKGARDPGAAPSSRCERVTLQGVTVTLTLDGLKWGGWNRLCDTLVRFLRPGAVPLPANATKVAERLLGETGYFATEDCQSAATSLTCRLTPQRMVYDVDITGDVPFSILKDDLRRRIFLRPGSLLTDEAATLARQRKRLEDYLRRQGYFGSVVHLAALDVDEAEPNQGVRLVAAVRPGRTVSLRHLDLRGRLPPKFTEKDVRAVFTHFLFLKWGRQRFQPAQFDDDLQALTRRLQALGYPEAQATGKWNLDLAHHQADVVLRIETGPKLVLRFEGNTHLKSAALKKLASFDEVGVIDPVEIASTAKAVVTRYQQDGYYAVKVDTRSETPSENVFDLTYVIHEGPRASVGKVVFQGNQAIPTATLRRSVSLHTRADAFLVTGRWVDAAAVADSRAIQAYYLTQGYGDAKVEATRTVLGEGRLEAVFHIEEGPRRVVSSLTVTGLPKALKEKALLAKLRLKARGPFIEDDVAADRRRILALLAGAGYSRSEVHQTVEAPPAAKGGPVKVVFTVTPGPQSIFGGALLRGNFRTVGSLLHNELSLEPGDALNLVALGQARRRLRNLGPFASVELKPLDLWRGDAQTWLLVALQERDVTALDGVLSFSTDQGFAVGFDYHDRDFLGRAIRLDLQLRTGAFGGFDPAVRIGNADSLNATLSAPRPLGAPFDLQATAFYRYQDLSRYTERRVGITAGAVRRFLRRSACPICPDATGTFRYEVSAGELDDHTRRFVAFDHSYGVPAANIGRLVPGLHLDRRDSFVDPRHGYAADLRFEFADTALSPIGKGASFWRIVASGQGYVDLGAPFARRLNEAGMTLGGPVVLATGLSYGAARPFGGDRALPESESFYYGGDFSVRGIADRASLAAFPGAQYLFVGSLEARWYFLQNFYFGSWQLALFANLGTVAYNFPELFQSSTLSLGVSLRFVTPVGPIAVSWADSVIRPEAILLQSPQSLPVAGRIHVTFGYPF